MSQQAPRTTVSRVLAGVVAALGLALTLSMGGCSLLVGLPYVMGQPDAEVITLFLVLGVGPTLVGVWMLVWGLKRVERKDPPPP
jgi:hypothetical protein